MTIVMAYHTLIDRNSKFVSRKWSLPVIIILCGICICGFIGAFNIHYLLESYNHNCIINSKLVFKHRENIVIPTTKTNDVDQHDITEIYTETTTIQNIDDILIGSTILETRLDITTIKNEEETDSNGTNHNKTQPGKIDDIYLRDNTYLEQTEIDEANTFWGKDRDCDYVTILPLFVSFCACIWITMFLICGKGGHASILMPRPWRIVVPSIIFFFIMVVLQLSNLIFVRSMTKSFCNQIQQNLLGEYSCLQLFEKFSMRLDHKSNSQAGRQYSIVMLTSWLSTVLWLILFLIMVVRLLLVIDFQLIKVTITKNTVESDVIVDVEKKNVKFAKDSDSEDEPDHFNEDDIDDETSFTTAPAVTPDNL